MSLFRVVLDYLFPPPWESKNAQMAKLLAAHPLPPPRARAAEPMSAVEREQTEALERRAEQAGKEAEEWLWRR